MKITVKENRELIVVNNQNTQNENNVEIVELTVPEKYNDFVKKIVFIIGENVISRTFENNQYIMERDILQNEHVLFYIWLTKETKDFRSRIKKLGINSNKSVNGEVTPAEQTEMERVISILESEITEVTELKTTLTNLINTIQTKLDNGEFNGKDGAKGEKGDPGEPGINGEDGKNGENGKDGANGQDGYTPQRGTDYWTNQDISAIESYCDTYIDSKIGSLSDIVNSIEGVVG
jgi:hypothetical protein